MPILLLAAFMATCLLGCTGNNNYKAAQPSGEPGQVLVVAGADLSDTPLAQALDSALANEYPFIPQAEPCFDLIYAPSSKFTGVLQNFRNIILVRPDSTVSECELSPVRNQWAHSQLVIILSGPSLNAIASHVVSHRTQLAGMLSQMEMDRLKNNLLISNSKELTSYLKRKFGLHMLVPENMSLRVNDEHFSWISLETKEISQSLLVYTTPFRGHWPSLKEYIAQRDSVTKKWIPGPNEGSYMIVSEVIPPELALMQTHADTLLLTRGFWDMHGYTMGGGFISITTRTPQGDSLLTTEAFLYAPSKHKRNYMRELEAILRTQLN